MADVTAPTVEICIRFVVRVSTESKQSVWMVGNILQLGSWKFSKRIALSTDGSGLWQCVVKSQVGKTLYYRYLICEDLDGRNGAVMTAWESGIKPRCFQPPDPGVLAGREFEVCQDDGTLSTLISHVPAGTEMNSVSSGCLTGQTEIHLRFHDTEVYPINLWTISKEQTKQLSIRVNPSYTPSTNQTLVPPHTIVKLLRGSKCDTFNLQPSCGVSLECEQNNMLVFTTQTFHVDKLMFTMYLYADGSSDSNQPLGMCCLVPDQLKGTNGVVAVTVFAAGSSSFQPIGSLSVDFLKIMPFDETLMDLSLSHCYDWNYRRPLYIGHRGMGMSLTLDKFNKQSDIPENSIHSFLSAVDHGADYIEFDVQLSQDKSLVLFHDLKIPGSLLGIDDDTKQLEISVKDCTSEQLSMLRVAPISSPLEGVPHKDLQFFPKLVEVFERVPEHVGFCIDIKYTETYRDESVEPYFDRNVYADLLLELLFSHAKSRPIVMASFDPDLCTILHLKQPRYPVLFLTCGVNDSWPEYQDVRQRTFESAVAFAKSERLLGLSAFSSPLLSDQSSLEMILKSGLVVFTWGDDNSDAGNVVTLKEAGVHAVICDRISELKLTV
ncbi:glycerophosphocholine phosphodiesterase GPCPD1-like isoform X2 [Corticium candelabrum]|uniref:glycerophosphocholine phosphodiesterase GPCPD1-like isoform X2 n=1 Tax=Corticium candelabrum TaxID=121492 RepID=UPI002E268DCB|nr:glycerophosphocholine phosphodiesterase GPCPD1-like isoform X2 [Corticium candelabrum]